MFKVLKDKNKTWWWLTETKEINKIMNGSEKLDNSIKNVNSFKESIWRVCFLNKNKALSGVWKEIAFKKR